MWFTISEAGCDLRCGLCSEPIRAGAKCMSGVHAPRGERTIFASVCRRCATTIADTVALPRIQVGVADMPPGTITVSVPGMEEFKLAPNERLFVQDGVLKIARQP